MSLGKITISTESKEKVNEYLEQMIIGLEGALLNCEEIINKSLTISNNQNPEFLNIYNKLVLLQEDLNTRKTEFETFKEDYDKNLDELIEADEEISVYINNLAEGGKINE